MEVFKILSCYEGSDKNMFFKLKEGRITILAVRGSDYISIPVRLTCQKAKFTFAELTTSGHSLTYGNITLIGSGNDEYFVGTIFEVSRNQDRKWDKVQMFQRASEHGVGYTDKSTFQQVDLPW